MGVGKRGRIGQINPRNKRVYLNLLNIRINLFINNNESLGNLAINSIQK